MEAESKELTNSISAIKVKRDALLKEKASVEQQTKELQSKLGKSDPKEHENLKRQKELLES